MYEGMIIFLYIIQILTRIMGAALILRVSIGYDLDRNGFSIASALGVSAAGYLLLGDMVPWLSWM